MDGGSGQGCEEKKFVITGGLPKKKSISGDWQPGIDCRMAP